MACWFLQPVQDAHAIWVPDEQYNPVWTPLGDETAMPTYDPATGDSDGNGVADWWDAFTAAYASNSLSYWAGGTFVVDGVSTTYGGVWHATSADSDGDLIPDDLDPYPSDSANNSFYWTGGTFTFNSITHAFRAGWYAGTIADNDSNGVPDSLDDWFTNPNLHGQLQYWGGGMFTISGKPSIFSPVNYYAASYVDSDSDGIPDELDPYPSDPWNNTNFVWQGGDYPINGALTHFAPATYGGFWVDADGDGIPDQADPLPTDANNNSEWWQGGSFAIDGQWQTFPAQWHRADAGDTDGDGIPDDLDPIPNWAGNWHTFDWAGGWFWINNQYECFGSGTYYGVWADADGDGIPDAVDPYPSDPNNGNVTTEFTWAGGTFQIDNQNQILQGGTFQGTWLDSDGDGIPDAADPYPYDAGNGNTLFYWAGGWFNFDNQATEFSPGYYAGDGSDSDGDGIPDVCDLYPYDAANGNQTFSWAGGTFRISDSDVYLSGGTFPGIWVDTDGDGIPDNQDPYPDDPNNGNYTGFTETFYWSGGTFRVNNADTTFAPGNYDGSWADSDGDGIPDSLDAYPSDSSNGNSTFYWNGGTYRISNQNQFFAAGTYNGVWADSDGDGIPDSLDPYPDDGANGNTCFYWAGGSFWVNNASLYYAPGYYDGTWADTDGDGIPDLLDAYPTDPANGNTQFHWNGGHFVINNETVFFANGDYAGTGTDTDGDGLPDILDPYVNDITNGNTSVDVFYWAGGSYYVDGVLATWAAGDYPGAWADTDVDGIPDSLDLHPEDPSNNSEYWAGGDFTINGFPVTVPGQWHRANAGDTDGDGLPDDIDPYPTDSANHPGFDWPAAATDYVIHNHVITFQPTHYGVNWQDTDADGIPDIADPYPQDPFNKNDTDGDGIPDSVETQYAQLGLDPHNSADAATQRQDGLTYLQAYQYNPSLPLDQLLDGTLDTDHDGIPDLVELLHGLNPFNPVDAAASKAGDFVSNLEKYQLGLNLDEAVSQSQYESVTGQMWDQFLLNHNQNLADAEDDPDGDGVSNIDELLIFHTNPHDSSSRPDDSQIILAIVRNMVSATTLINYNSLVNNGGSGGDNSGGDGGGDNTGTGAGGDNSGSGGGGDNTGSGGSGGDTGSGSGGTDTGGGTGGAGDGGDTSGAGSGGNSSTDGSSGGSGTGDSGQPPPLPTSDYDQELVSTQEITTTLSVIEDPWICEGGLTPAWLNSVVTPYILWSQSVHTTFHKCTVSVWRWRVKGETSWNTTVPYIMGEPTGVSEWTAVTFRYMILGAGQDPP